MNKIQIALSDTFTKLGQVWKSYSSKEYRDASVRANIVSGIAAQIYRMRERAGISQNDLAAKCGMKQTRISLLENGSTENPTIDTLARVASAFDVALIVRYVPFSELAKWSTSITEQKLSPTEYGRDSLTTVPISDASAIISFESAILAMQRPFASAWEAATSVDTMNKYIISGDLIPWESEVLASAPEQEIHVHASA
jgi:transcriptional regulator with XRE-family HTH domain